MAGPACRGDTGVMGFIVGNDGVVCQRHVGRATPQLLTGIHWFDPERAWKPSQPCSCVC